MGKKWDQDARPAEKLLSLYSILLWNPRAFSLSELSRQLQCSKQSVNRLLDQLEASQAGKLQLLRSQQGREKFYQLARPRRLPNLSLSGEGLAQLILCRDFMFHLLPESMRENVDITLERAAAFLPQGEDWAPPPTMGQSLLKGWIDYTPLQGVFENIMQAVRQARVCRVKYKSFSTQRGQQPARAFLYAPRQMLAYSGVIYVSGWIVQEKGVSIEACYENPTFLALHRLERAALTQLKAEHLGPVEPPLPQDFGLFADEPCNARIRFDPSAAVYVAERKWSREQKVRVHKDGSITLTLRSLNPDELIAWVLSFGDSAQILSPQNLRREMADRVKRMAALYAPAG